MSFHVFCYWCVGMMFVGSVLCDYLAGWIIYANNRFWPSFVAVFGLTENSIRLGARFYVFLSAIAFFVLLTADILGFV